jgi:DNA-binding NtrC family response regulator
VKRELEVLVGQMIEKGVFYGDAVGEFERTFIRGVLEKNRGNRSRAAKSLGIHRNTLGRKLEELGLNNHHKARKPTAR